MPTSLLGRLLIGTTAFALVVLVVTLMLMEHVFERFVTGQIDQRLDNKLVSLASQVRVAPDRTVSLDGDADGPPFDEPRHLSFWRVAGPRNAIESRWLVPGAFRPPSVAEIEAAPSPPPPPHLNLPRGGATAFQHPRTLKLPGPDGMPMHIRAVVRDYAGVRVAILSAAPQRAIADPIGEALMTLTTSLLILALILVIAGAVMARVTLHPLRQLRRDVADVRLGKRAFVPNTQPYEIRSLVDELNDLLVQNAANLARARKHVANLAHGLKTPLATLALGIARLERAPRDDLQPFVQSIERQVRHHLGRARAAALEGPVRQQTKLAPHLDDIIDALKKVYAEKRLVVEAGCPVDLNLTCEPQDVDEILGNLLDNAFKYARTRVACRATLQGKNVCVEISDDGPGLKAEDIDRVLRPGQRLDEQIPGFGFGLPIARELIELYGGDLTLHPLDPGLAVRCVLPIVPGQAP